MANYLFPKFQEDKNVFLETVQWWIDLLNDAVKRAGINDWTATPATDLDGRNEPEHRGNPILWASSESQGRTIQVVQFPPSGRIFCLGIELNDFGDPAWDDHKRNLMIRCILREDMVSSIRRLFDLFVDAANGEAEIQRYVDELNAAEENRMEAARAQALKNSPDLYYFPNFDRNYDDYIAAQSWWLNLFRSVVAQIDNAETWMVNTFFVGGHFPAAEKWGSLLSASTGDSWSRYLKINQVPPGHMQHDLIASTYHATSDSRVHKYNLSIDCTLTAESADKARHLLSLFVNPEVSEAQIEAYIRVTSSLKTGRV